MKELKDLQQKFIKKIKSDIKKYPHFFDFEYDNYNKEDFEECTYLNDYIRKKEKEQDNAFLYGSGVCVDCDSRITCTLKGIIFYKNANSKQKRAVENATHCLIAEGLEKSKVDNVEQLFFIKISHLFYYKSNGKIKRTTDINRLLKNTRN